MVVSTAEILKRAKKMDRARWCKLTETSILARGKMTKCTESAFILTPKKKLRSKAPGKMEDAPLG